MRKASQNGAFGKMWYWWPGAKLHEGRWFWHGPNLEEFDWEEFGEYD